MKRHLLAVLLLSGTMHTPGAGDKDAPYVVKDGRRVDAGTLEGWRTWRAMRILPLSNTMSPNELMSFTRTRSLERLPLT